MSKFFQVDNSVFTVISKIVDIMWISLLWSLMSLPLVWSFFISFVPADQPLSALNGILIIEMLIKGFFIGPATSAMYYTIVKVIRRERDYATRQFFHSFKENFKVGCISSLLYVLFGILMVLDLEWALQISNEGSRFGTVYFIIFLAGSIFATFMLVWIFPILSRFTVNVKMLFKNAFLISVRHFVKTLIVIALVAAVLFLLAITADALGAFYYLMPCIVPGLVMLVASFVIEPVLQKYTAAAEGTPEETGEDQWYRE